jgi:hypothetical protein
VKQFAQVTRLKVSRVLSLPTVYRCKLFMKELAGRNAFAITRSAHG